MDFGLRQKVAIVCAASKGLGRACATMLAREGANVVVCARNEQALNEAVQSIRTEGGAQVLPVVCDLTRGEDIERLMEKSVEEFGTVHILVTNVGHPQMGAFSDLNEVDWQHGYEGVLLPVIRLCRLVIPHMRKAEWGRIVHITSVAVREPGTPYTICRFKCTYFGNQPGVSRAFLWLMKVATPRVNQLSPSKPKTRWTFSQKG